MRRFICNKPNTMICIKMFILKLQARNLEKLLQANKQSPTRIKMSRKTKRNRFILPQIRIQKLNLATSALVDK